MASSMSTGCVVGHVWAVDCDVASTQGRDDGGGNGGVVVAVDGVLSLVVPLISEDATHG